MTKADSKAKFSFQKWMLSIWWGVKGVIYWELQPGSSQKNAMKYIFLNSENVSLFFRQPNESF